MIGRSDEPLLDGRREDGQGGRARHWQEFSGRAHRPGGAALVEKLLVDYYGSEVPLQQIAGFRCPRPGCS